ncbi:right-handed parallel beta-helix repeat-containing protein [Actinomycetospora soli]|uniref:right-handed parallel beta-helix repeat-containing protein n=1 Tax=Actinomycetospora soli TaxID=2893887 RepID=UPI001E2C5DDF|nr:right-handed parallel beta-helix repeat-containing protein [Actinomycetospora soli]MCD2185916.1 right-handed parallel beta-helix repeat-containing protein [Actinomycetospora soli]
MAMRAGRFRRAVLAGAMGIACAVTTTGVAAAAAPAPAPAGATVVGTKTARCPATVATIQAAVTAATPGSTIFVCAGTYPERVSITKPVRLLGAQYGRDARGGRTNAADESVVTGATGGFAVGTVSGVVIDGFTISGSGANGIDAFSKGNGFTIVNNVITGNANGMNVNATGPAPSTIARNRIVANNAVPDPQGGTGVLITSGAANALTISDNLFGGHTSAAVNSIGDPGNRSRGLVVRDNRSVDDATLVVINNADGALVTRNIATKSPTAVAGTGIFVVGNTDRLTVSRNVLTGGKGNGLSANGAVPFGAAPSTNLVVDTNTISGRTGTGILINEGAGTVVGNVVAASGANGVAAAATATGVRFERNVATGSVGKDCADASTGAGTLGTANTWVRNVGRTATPTGLCLPGR